MKSERTPARGSAHSFSGDLPKKKPSLRKVWPEVRELIRPRRGLLLFGLILMAINRVAGLVLPISTK
jgi:subfamily B ATP-binding cassette protein MsbA